MSAPGCLISAFPGSVIKNEELALSLYRNICEEAKLKNRRAINVNIR
jgi:hypothetical protein